MKAWRSPWKTILSTTANWLVTNINPDGFTATAGLLSTILLGLLILALEETDDKKKRPVIRLALMRDFFSLLLFASILLLLPVFFWPTEQSSGNRPYSTLESSKIILPVISFIVGVLFFFQLLLRLGKWITNPLSNYDVTAQSEAVLKYFRRLGNNEKALLSWRAFWDSLQAGANWGRGFQQQMLSAFLQSHEISSKSDTHKITPTLPGLDQHTFRFLVADDDSLEMLADWYHKHINAILGEKPNSQYRSLIFFVRETAADDIWIAEVFFESLAKGIGDDTERMKKWLNLYGRAYFMFDTYYQAFKCVNALPNSWQIPGNGNEGSIGELLLSTLFNPGNIRKIVIHQPDALAAAEENIYKLDELLFDGTAQWEAFCCLHIFSAVSQKLFSAPLDERCQIFYDFLSEQGIPIATRFGLDHPRNDQALEAGARVYLRINGELSQNEIDIWTHCFPQLTNSPTDIQGPSVFYARTMEYLPRLLKAYQRVVNVFKSQPLDNHRISE
ncbi:hypothetical protein I6E06_00705 [Bifidobacterium boum]|uniref:hypothetical protein n=1 Tax=Bifidobacterium boum TaxID=78343 RepID=UPI001F2879DE|nr:hypothetical protein [Bifidobacterium boum]MCF2561020.1 hypothetical protein [Bifidobacterium boum]